MKNLETKKLIDLLTVTDTKGASFLGIRNYESSKTGELANYVVISNFSYANAIAHDMKALTALTNNDLTIISKDTGLDIEVLKQAKTALLTSFEKNQNKETQSNQSKAQQDIYIKLNDAIKVHKETEQVYIYALAHKKVVIEKGTYPTVNSRELTKAKNAIKKACGFKTAKYRLFIVDKNQLTSVKIKGTEVII
jgi:inosine/xanthosine triphosphate pyrophosphatase family protein